MQISISALVTNLLYHFKSLTAGNFGVGPSFGYIYTLIKIFFLKKKYNFFIMKSKIDYSEKVCMKLTCLSFRSILKSLVRINGKVVIFNFHCSSSQIKEIIS